MGRIGWKDDRSTDSIRDLYYGGTEAGGVQNVNFLAIFWHFPNPHINWDQKSLEEQGKVEKLQNGSPYSRNARISGHTGFLRLKSGRIVPDNVPDFPGKSVLSGFCEFLSDFQPKLPITPPFFHEMIIVSP